MGNEVCRSRTSFGPPPYHCVDVILPDDRGIAGQRNAPDASVEPVKAMAINELAQESFQGL